MDSPSAILSSPTKALNPVSPERMNQQAAMPASPSRASEPFRSHHRKGSRGLSEVQAKVAFLNNLSGGSPVSAASQSAGNASIANPAALQRAMLGREEAESALQAVSTQLSEAQSRERRINERLESLTNELQAAKDRQSNERSVFEKEIRKARKEAFRASSAVVKFQEDLKEARLEVRSLKDEVQAEREAKDQANQEAFERAYVLASLTEESEVLKGRLRAAETSNQSHTLEARAHDMRKDDIGRLSLAEGDLAMLLTPTPRRPKRSAEDSATSPMLHLTNDSSTQCTPPKRPRLSDYTPRQEDYNITKLDSQRDQLEKLQQMLDHERQRRVDAEEMVQFMQLECRFKRCSCRLEEDEATCKHTEVPHVDTGNITRIDHETKAQNSRLSGIQKTRNRARPPVKSSRETTHVDSVSKVEQNQETPEDEVVTFSPETGTFRTVSSPLKPQDEPPAPSRPLASGIHQVEESIMHSQPDPQEEPLEHHEVPALSRSHPFTPSPSTALDQFPREGHPLSVEQNAEFDVDTSGYPITKRVPLRTEEPLLSNQSTVVPGTPVSREQALAQIRARRGRANSVKRSVSAGESMMNSAAPPASASGTSRRVRGAQSTGARESAADYHREPSSGHRSYRR